jgi:diadenosine tetraphosphate (Ap4A) HIT family hydrolase
VPCHFCDLIASGAGRESVLVEDDRVIALLHDDWAVRGHAVVVWKGHVENLSDLSPADGAYLIGVFQRVELSLLGEAAADRAILMKLGLAVPHLHLHIYPVSRNDDRAHVMAAIDGKIRAAATEAEKRSFVAAVRERLAR